MTETALELRDLDVVYTVRGIDRPVLRGVSLEIQRGQSYGLVGESGCGKSTAALAVVRYLARNGRVSGGSIAVAGRDVLALGRGELREFRARTVSMVYQNPGAALNPSIRTGKQVAEAFTVLGASQGEAADRAREALAHVQIADPGSVMSRYPHQLSGGMQQRVVIAMALAKNPELLILDEPTAGVDVKGRAEFLELLAGISKSDSIAAILVTHNVAAVTKTAERIVYLEGGRLVAWGLPDELLGHDRLTALAFAPPQDHKAAPDED
jgi:peptide/nickel transport system ATP-binding protein